jgi:hypothetical protein
MENIGTTDCILIIALDLIFWAKDVIALAVEPFIGTLINLAQFKGAISVM